MELILIACCKTKAPGGTITYPGSELEQDMPAHAYRRLLEARRELAALLGEQAGPDLGGPASSEPIPYLPAWQRYEGVVYSKGGVAELYPRAQGKRIMIVSTLYGILDAADPVRPYDIRMDCRLRNGSGSKTLKTWWKCHELGRIVEECILALKPTCIRDLLPPTTYRPALAPWPPRSFREEGITYDPRVYPGRNGSNHPRGDDLRRLLSGT